MKNMLFVRTICVGLTFNVMLKSNGKFLSFGAYMDAVAFAGYTI